MSERKKIFAIISYPFLPATTGGEISTLQILSFIGHQTDLKIFTVDPYKPVDQNSFSFDIEFGMRFKLTRYLNPFLLFGVLSKIKTQGADAIFFDQPFMGWMIPFLRLFTGKKVFIRSNNIEYLRFKSMGKSWWPLMRLYEKWVYRLANLVIFVSDVDQQKAIHGFGLNPNKTLLTPYGIPQKEVPALIPNAQQIIRQRHNLGSNQKILLFFATLSYQPNFEAVEFIADHISPLLQKELGDNFCILICGKNLPEPLVQKVKANPQLQYLGFVEDIETYIDGADVMINPILSGGGVKTKAIDTLGRGQTVISTTTGAEGINPGVCGKNLQVAPDHNWPAFVGLITKHFGQDKPQIPDSFFEVYSWPGIVSKLLEKLNEHPIGIHEKTAELSNPISQKNSK